MKTTKINLPKLFKIGILFFGISFLLLNCERDEFIENSDENATQKEMTIRKIGKNEIQKNTQIGKYLNNTKKIKVTSYFSKSIKDANTGLEIDTDYATYIELLDGYHSYTFTVVNTPENGGLQNVLLSLQQDGTYKEYLTQYDITPEEIEKLRNNEEIDLAGKVKMIELNSNFSDNLSQKVIYQDQCVTIEYIQNTCSGGVHTYGQECSYDDNRVPGKYPAEPGGTYINTFNCTGGNGGGSDESDNNNASDGSPSPNGGRTGKTNSITTPTPPEKPECSLSKLDNLAFSIGLSPTIVNCIKEKEDCDFTNKLESFLKANNNANGIAFANLAAEATCDGASVDWEELIINKLTGKEKCAYENLNSLKLFKSTIGKFEKSKKYNLILNSWTKDACNSKSDDGCTDARDLKNGNINIFIQNIGEGTLDVAALILHEGIHAEIYKYVDEFKKGLDPNMRKELLEYYFEFKAQNDNTLLTSNAQHQYMADNYVRPIAEALKQLDNNKYPLNDYMGLAWDGLRRYGWDGYFDNGKWITLDRNAYSGTIRKVLDNTSFNKNCN